MLVNKKADIEYSRIPDWYEFERACVKKQIEKGEYLLRDEVTIEALPNEKGFIHLGNGILEHDAKGFQMTILNTGETKRFSSISMFSAHTEYDYRGKGDCIVLSTKDCCYYIYPVSKNFNVTKIQFAAEIFHDAISKCER